MLRTFECGDILELEPGGKHIVAQIAARRYRIISLVNGNRDSDEEIYPCEADSMRPRFTLRGLFTTRANGPWPVKIIKDPDTGDTLAVRHRDGTVSDYTMRWYKGDHFWIFGNKVLLVRSHRSVSGGFHLVDVKTGELLTKRAYNSGRDHIALSDLRKMIRPLGLPTVRDGYSGEIVIGA